MRFFWPLWATLVFLLTLSLEIVGPTFRAEKREQSSPAGRFVLLSCFFFYLHFLSFHFTGLVVFIHLDCGLQRQ